MYIYKYPDKFSIREHDLDDVDFITAYYFWAFKSIYLGMLKKSYRWLPTTCTRFAPNNFFEEFDFRKQHKYKEVFKI